MNIEWGEFLGRLEKTVAPALAAAASAGKRVLITGAGGSIGSGLVHAVLLGGPDSLVLLDSSEHALYECLRCVSGNYRMVPTVGDVCDAALLDWIFAREKPELVFHAAAYKHVPLMELNPFSAMRNNAIGTYRLVSAALKSDVRQFVLVSTDKAVNPHSAMGASKRIAELIVLSHATARNRMNAVRLGNVLESSGSVVPIFQEQVRKGLPLTVTDAQASRYFITLAEAQIALLSTATSAVSGKILIPNCGSPISIVELARFVARDADVPIEYVGLRRGDKLREELVAENERVTEARLEGMRIVTSPVSTAADIVSAVEQLGRAIEKFDSLAMHEIVAGLVPSYQPSFYASADAVTEAQ